MAKAKNTYIKKTFEQWLPAELQNEFGLTFQFNMPELEEWLQAESPIPPEVAPTLEKLKQQLKVSHSYWNEQDLIFKFIAPFLSLVDFTDPHYNYFTERKLKAHLGAYELTGVVDFVVSKGYKDPQKPYFFLHEYKRFKGTEADPLGQVLSEMLTAQTLNADGKPIYGCYVYGQHWTFVLLNQNVYATSQGYDATAPEELQKVWSVLQETKRRIVIRANEDQ